MLSSLPGNGRLTPVQQPGLGAQPGPAPPVIAISAGHVLGLVIGLVALSLISSGNAALSAPCRVSVDW
jgi:hypothetical protein